MRRILCLCLIVVSLFMAASVSEARWYSPETGRFLTRDPLGHAGGDTNLYRFVGNNPVNFIDPWGLWYIDLNISITLFKGVGITGGALVGPEGMHPYFGGGYVSKPGGLAITWSPHDASPGWNAGFQAGALLGGQYGYSFSNRETFWEVGYVTPGYSLTGYHIWNPEYNKSKQRDCEAN